MLNAFFPLSRVFLVTCAFSLADKQVLFSFAGRILVKLMVAVRLPCEYCFFVHVFSTYNSVSFIFLRCWCWSVYLAVRQPLWRVQTAKPSWSCLRENCKLCEETIGRCRYWRLYAGAVVLRGHRECLFNIKVGYPCVSYDVSSPSPGQLYGCVYIVLFPSRCRVIE